jgi:hypothetical protein
MLDVDFNRVRAQIQDCIELNRNQELSLNHKGMKVAHKQHESDDKPNGLIEVITVSDKTTTVAFWICVSERSNGRIEYPYVHEMIAKAILNHFIAAKHGTVLEQPVKLFGSNMRDYENQYIEKFEEIKWKPMAQ